MGAKRDNLAKIATKNSPHCGRKIVVYTTSTIETLIRAYALAASNNKLRQNQLHIGKRAIALCISLVRTALDASIKEACGLSPEVQKTAQKNYINATEIIREFGFKYCYKKGYH